MILALRTLVNFTNYWTEQQKNQVLAWLDCAEDFGKQVDELANKNEQAKKIIKEFLKYIYTPEGFEKLDKKLIEQAEQFLKE